MGTITTDSINEFIQSKGGAVSVYELASFRAIAEAQGDTSIEDKTKILISTILFGVKRFMIEHSLTISEMYPNVGDIQDVVKYLSEEFWINFGIILINWPEAANRILTPHLKTIAILDDLNLKAKVIESAFDAVLGEYKETLRTIKDMTTLKDIVMSIVTKTDSYAKDNV